MCQKSRPLRGSLSTEPIQELSMNPAEAAIAEDADNIPAAGVFGEMSHDRVRVRQVGSLLASRLEVPHQPFGVESLIDADLLEAGDFGDIHPGYAWRREILQVQTNGLFRVDFWVWSSMDKTATESRMSILLYRPDSIQRSLR